MTESGRPETGPASRPEARPESRERWVAAATILLLVLLPVLGGRILSPGWTHPAHLGDEEDGSAASGPPKDLAGQGRQPGSESDAELDTRQNAATDDGGAPADPEAPWRYAAAGEVWSQPVRWGDFVLVGSDAGEAHALDAATGRAAWTLEVGAAVRHPAAATAERSFWTSADGVVHAADGDGRRIWRRRADATSGPAVGGGGKNSVVVVGTEDGLLALAVDDGRVVWRAAVGAVQATPAVSPASAASDASAGDGARAVAGTLSGAVVAVDLRRGQTLWRFDTGAEISTSPTLAGRYVLVTAGDGTVYGLDLDTGRERWRSGTSEFVGSAPAVSGGRVFVGGGDGALWAFDLESGLRLWRRGLAEPVRGTPVADGTTLWMAAGERYLAAVRATDGEPLHVFAVGGWVSASPLVVSPEREQEGRGPKRLVWATADGNVHGVPMDVVVDELALRSDGPSGDGTGGDRPAAETARLVVEPTFHDGTPELLWQADLPGRPVAAPAVTAGRVVVGAGRVLLALDAETGEELWRRQTAGELDAPPVVVGSRVLAARRAGPDGRGALEAYDLDGGERLWRAAVDDDVTSAPAVWRGRAVFGTAAGRVLAVRLDDGSILWSAAVDGAVTAAPAVAGAQGFGIVVVGGCEGAVYGLSADDGRELWRAPTAGCVATDAVVAPSSGQDVAYAADAAGHVYAFDPAVGGELWRASLGGAAGRRLLVHEGTLYLGSRDGNLWSLSALHGDPRWRFDAGGARRGSVSGGVALDLGIVYAASTDGALHAVGAINGQAFWRLETPGPAYDVAFHDGVVYGVTGRLGDEAPAEGGRLYALRVP